MEKKTRIIDIAGFVVLIILVTCGPVLAQKGTQTDIREELGVERMAPIYTEANAVISQLRPTIAIDLASLDREPDKETFEILLDGRSITLLCEITRQYIICDLDGDLAPGAHDVLVTGQDKAGVAFPPLGYRFRIEAEAVEAVEIEKADRTSGRIVFSTETVEAKYVPSNVVDVSGQFERPEGEHHELDFSFTHTSEGRTLTGSVSREVRSYGGLEVDKARMSYFASATEGYEFDAGDFWSSWTPLGLRGTQYRGLEYGDKAGWGHWSAIVGRSQDPSTSGSYKEYGGGATVSWDTSASNVLTLTGLMAQEQEDQALSVLRGTRRRNLFTFEDRWAATDNLSIRAEVASVRVDEDGGEDEDSGAWELEAEYRERTWNLKVKGFRYGTDFYPMAEGSAQDLVNDKQGINLNAGIRPSNKWSLGGEYERYDSLNDGRRTFDKNMEYVSWRPGEYLPQLSLRHSGLSVSGAIQNDSKTDLAMLNWTLPGTSFTSESRLFLMWQGVSFSGLLTAGNIETRSRMRYYSFNTSLWGRANVSWDHSDSSTVDRIASTRSKARNDGVALSITIVPFKLLGEIEYSLDRATGTSSDTRLKEWGLGFKWYTLSPWSLRLRSSWVEYTDRINGFYDYDQFILKLEAERRF